MRTLVALAPVLLLATAAVPPAHAACTPLSAAETGCVPPDKATLRCELGVNRNVARVHAAVARCHKQEADIQFHCQGRPARGACKTKRGVCDNGTCNDGVTACMADGECPPALFNDESCESLTGFDAANTRLNGCPACLSVPNAARAHTAGAAALALHDTVIELLTYCAGTGKHLGDQGLLPPDAATLRCEDAFGRNVARFLKAILACHGRAAAAGVKGTSFDAAGCETAAASAFDAANARLTGCGACTPGAAANVRTSVRAAVDDDQKIFCAPTTPTSAAR